MKKKFLTKALVLAMSTVSIGLGSVSYADTNVSSQNVDAVSEADKNIQELSDKQKELNNKIGQVKEFSKRRELRKSVRDASSLKELEELEKEVESLLGNTKEDKKDSKSGEDNFEDEKEKAIKNFENSKDQLTPEAQKDGIKEVLKTSNSEELGKALARFNPQGPPEEYPTTAKNYELNSNNNGFNFKIDGNEFSADNSGNLALDRNYTGETPKDDLAYSELNAYISKYIVNQKNLSLRDQAEIENKIDAFNDLKRNKKLNSAEVVKAHKELNDKLLAISGFEYKDEIKKDNEVLDQLLKDIDSNFKESSLDKGSTNNENEDKKPETSTPETRTLEKDKQNNVKPVSKDNDNKNVEVKADDKKEKDNSKEVVKTAGNNAQTGVVGLTGVVGVLASASVAYFESKRKS